MKFVAIAIPIFFAGISAANATPVTSPTALAGGTIVDFESFSIGTTGPITSSGMVISATPASAPVTSLLGYTQYPGIVTGKAFGFNDNIIFEILLDNPAYTFGMGVFDVNFVGNAFSAYDANGNVLETILSGTSDFPIGPTGGSWSTYVGFTYNTAVIKKIKLVGAPGDLLSIDNVGYQSVPGPVPTLGAAAVFGYSRKLRKRIKKSNKTVSSPNGC